MKPCARNGSRGRSVPEVDVNGKALRRPQPTRVSAIGLLTLMTLTLGILRGPTFVGAQQPTKVPRVGVLFSGAPATSSQSAAAFEQGLREHGYGGARQI